MLKKLAVISGLILNTLHPYAEEPALTEDTNFNLMQRVVYVHHFIDIATNASTINDNKARSAMNAQLKAEFDQMKHSLGYHPLVSFHNIKTKQKAESAITAYTNIKQKLFDLITAQ